MENEGNRNSILASQLFCKSKTVLKLNIFRNTNPRLLVLKYKELQIVKKKTTQKKNEQRL